MRHVWPLIASWPLTSHPNLWPQAYSLWRLKATCPGIDPWPHTNLLWPHSMTSHSKLISSCFDFHWHGATAFLLGSQKYSLNVKEWNGYYLKEWNVKTTLTEWKLLLKRVKIIPKWVKITPKRVKITPIEWISLFGEAHIGTALLFRAVPLCAPP